MKRVVMAVIAAVVFAATAEAQSVNPSKFAWEHDAESRSVTTHYEIGYFLAGASTPVQSIEVPVGSTTSVSGQTYETLVPRPVLGVFSARAKACGTAVGGSVVCSEWSNSTDPFALSPRAIAALRIGQ